ncbi:bifunctional metallophosphatase/5'-nucleotidase [uncultured Tenacibaculum sp.]|uniref:bifunctional metallophosphatase/5'-nucleotidase n=1 Tax=uncultured Tenacibaculum sp. TaxID=174713 RepID=UPI00262F0D1A|nr:bifunctional metallophosphatase/5'-nucleotidase [uncultured Tenacibaculum sp.]
MKLKKQLFFFLPLLLLYFSCSTQNKASKALLKQSNYSFKKAPNKTYFSIVQLNDVYEIAPIQNGKFGGMARVETIHQEVLKENKNSMLVLAGDFLNPSLLGTLKINGERVRGKQMVEVMNAMNFDLVAFGNHEFDLSYTNLQKRLNESNFDWISANVLHKEVESKKYFYKIKNQKKQILKDSYIKEFKNSDGSILRVGFISVCIPSNPKNYVFYGDMFEEIKRAYNEIKPKVDIVLGLTHVKVEQDRIIAKLLPDLALIMGGHEHTNSYENINNVIIAKADANAKTVYIHRFEYDRLTKKVKVKSELKEVNKSIIPNKKIENIVSKWEGILNTKIKEVVASPNEVIYNTKEPLEARDTPVRSIQTNMGNMITKAMSYAYNDKVDCALVNGGSIRIDDVLEGKITAVDVFRVLPYGGAILKVEIKGSLLKKVLDFGLSASGTGAFLQRYNVSKKSGNWYVKAKKIDENKVYKVAFSDYLLKGFDIPFLSNKNPEVLSIYKPKSIEKAFDIRKAIIDYMKKL